MIAVMNLILLLIVVPVKETFASPVTVTEFNTVVNCSPVTLASGAGSTSPSTIVKFSPVKETLTAMIAVTEFSVVVNCSPVKERFASPVTVTEF
jgi:hypothetical protein